MKLLVRFFIRKVTFDVNSFITAIAQSALWLFATDLEQTPHGNFVPVTYTKYSDFLNIKHKKHET